MSHYPCLQKSFIEDFLDGNNKITQNNWKNQLSSKILNQYIQIKRQQDREISEILPKYQIFPKKYSQYNIYTSNYDIDRLQRIRNGQNEKYQQKNLIKFKSSQKKNYEDEPFRTSSSQLVMGSKVSKMRQKQVESKSAIKFYESKSTKSLAQTNVSPSKMSINICKRIDRINYAQSDSEVSLGLSKQSINHKNLQYSNIKSMQENLQKSSNKKIFQNQQSVISLSSKFRNLNKNEEQSKDKLDNLQTNIYHTQKNVQGYFLIHNEGQSQKLNQNLKKNKSSLKNQVIQKQNPRSHKKQSKQQEQSFQKIKNTEQTRKNYHLTNQAKANNHQNVEIYLQNSNSFDQTQDFNFAKQKITENYHLKDQIPENWGQEFERIKAERDFLRKHFIYHLQNKHTSQLPYSKLTSINVNLTGQQLTIHTHQIPTKNHQRISKTISIIKSN